MLEERLGARSEQLEGFIPIPGSPFKGFAQVGPFADPTRTLLGAEQEAWLANRLRTSTARWKLIGQGVMFAQLKAVGAPNAVQFGGVFLNPDQWDGYQPARDRIYDILKGDGVNIPPICNCVFLTGDIHSSWAADLSQDPNNPVVQAGGYDPATGAGSRAVEFVTTSVSSPGLSDPTGQVTQQLLAANPHFKFIDLNQRGYMVVDVTPERAVCEWWFVDTVDKPSHVETFGKAFQVAYNSDRLAPAQPTMPRDDAPPLAPERDRRDCKDDHDD
jgi:alkaline phosphatase D